jgi:hypothetical protein
MKVLNRVSLHNNHVGLNARHARIGWCTSSTKFRPGFHCYHVVTNDSSLKLEVPNLLKVFLLGFWCTLESTRKASLKNQEWRHDSSGWLQVGLHFRCIWRSWLPDLVTERPACQRGLFGVVRKEDWMCYFEAGWYEFTRYRRVLWDSKQHRRHGLYGGVHSILNLVSVVKTPLMQQEIFLKRSVNLFFSILARLKIKVLSVSWSRLFRQQGVPES